MSHPKITLVASLSWNISWRSNYTNMKFSNQFSKGFYEVRSLTLFLFRVFYLLALVCMWLWPPSKSHHLTVGTSTWSPPPPPPPPSNPPPGLLLLLILRGASNTSTSGLTHLQFSTINKSLEWRPTSCEIFFTAVCNLLLLLALSFWKILRPKYHDWHIWHIWARQIWWSGVSLKRSCKMQLRCIDLVLIKSPSQKLWLNQFFSQFSHFNYNVKIEMVCLMLFMSL